MMDDYTQFLINKADKYINSYDGSHEHIRELLILSSSKTVNDKVDDFLLNKVKNGDVELLEKLVDIASDEDDYGGDAPRNACFFIKNYDPKMLKKYEDILLKLFKDDEEIKYTFLAIALAKMKSLKAKDIIYSSYDEQVYSNWIIVDAIKIYEEKTKSSG